MTDNTDFIRKHNMELLADGYEQNRTQANDATAKIDYNIMMGNLEDPTEDENE